MAAASSRAIWAEYERRKRSWLALHPAATADEIEHACRRIARELGL
ncbi:hypothetical protein [Methylibium sp. Pch-M]|nr:hypothetical protein [Methylibium sp. Pch-M]